MPAPLGKQLILQRVGCPLHTETAASFLLRKNGTSKERGEGGCYPATGCVTALTGSAVAAGGLVPVSTNKDEERLANLFLKKPYALPLRDCF